MNSQTFNKRAFLSKLFAVAALALITIPAVSADVYPSRPIKVIVPFAAGGSNDIVARALQLPLGKALNATILVENLPGASTKIGVSAAMRAEPDGYTLMLASLDSTMAYFYSGAFDVKVWEKLVPIGRSGQMAWGLLEARADAPFKGWKGMVEYGKRNAKGLSVGGPGSGGMMNLIALESGKASGTSVTYIPYNGGGPSGTALLGGHVEYRVAQPSEVLANVRAGKTQVLAVGFPSRLPELPDVPTFREVGIGLDVPTFGFDLWGPPNLPATIATQLSNALEQAVKDPEFVEVARRLTYQPMYLRAADLQRKAAEFEARIAPLLQTAFPIEIPKK